MFKVSNCGCKGFGFKSPTWHVRFRFKFIISTDIFTVFKNTNLEYIYDAVGIQKRKKRRKRKICA